MVATGIYRWMGSASNLRLVASGHLHLNHETMWGLVRYAWAPAVSFIVAEDEQPG